MLNNKYIHIFAVSPPKISEHPNDLHITVHDSVLIKCTAHVLFKCTAHGFGTINIFWKRVKYNMPVTAEVIERKTLNGISSILNITKTVGYYSGQYYCVAENKAGKVMSQTANLHVQGNNVCYTLCSYVCVLTVICIISQCYIKLVD